jgi:hypothetical protein
MTQHKIFLLRAVHNTAAPVKGTNAQNASHLAVLHKTATASSKKC